MRYASADEPTLRGPEWIEQQWEAARLARRRGRQAGAVLVLDEVQKVRGWSERSSGCGTRTRAPGARSRWCCSARRRCSSSAGLTESLAGRFEILRLPHWSLAEMRDGVRLVARPVPLLRRLPGRAPLIERAGALGALHPRLADRDDDLPRRAAADAGGQAGAAAAAVRAGLPLLGPDPLVHQDARPAPGRRQHHDPGPLPRPAGGARACSPACRSTPADVVAPARLEPQAAGAQHGADDGAVGPDARRGARRTASSGAGWSSRRSARTWPTRRRPASCELFYWRERNSEVDFVVQAGRDALGDRGQERTRAARPPGHGGVRALRSSRTRKLLVGGDGIALEEFLSRAGGALGRRDDAPFTESVVEDAALAWLVIAVLFGLGGVSEYMDLGPTPSLRSRSY